MRKGNWFAIFFFVSGEGFGKNKNNKNKNKNDFGKKAEIVTSA